MPENNSVNVCGFLTLMALVFLVSAGSVMAAGLNYSGGVNLRENDLGGVTRSENHSVALSNSQRPTNYIKAAESVRYAYTGGKDDKAERLSESFTLVDNNGFFAVNLSGAANYGFVADQKRDANERIAAGFTGLWQNDLFPSLSVDAARNVQQRYSAGDDRKNVDLRSDVTLDWHRSALALYYNYRFNEQDSGQDNVANTTEEHNGNISFADSYFDKRLKVVFGQSASFNRREFGQLGKVGLLPIFVPEVRTGPDNTPLDNTEATTVNNLMRDGDLAILAYNVAANSTFNNIMLVLNNQTFDRVYLYTQTPFPALPPGLTWTLATNDSLLTGWTDASAAITGVIYNVAEQRFEISCTPLAGNYVKIGLDYLSIIDPDIDFTEVQLFSSGVVSGLVLADENSSFNTNLTISASLATNLDLDYNLGRNSREVQGLSSFKSEGILHRATLKYESSDKTITSNLSMSLASDQNYSGESSSAKYTFSVAKAFLPTLDGDFSCGKNYVYSFSDLILENFYYRFSSTAQLYPDLGMTADFTTNESSTYTGILEKYSKSNTFSLAVTTRLVPEITLHLSWAVAATIKPVSNTSSTTGGYFSWRVSRALSLSLNGNYAKASNDDPGLFTFGSTLQLALAKNALLSAAHSYHEGVDGKTTQSSTANFNWTIRKGLRFTSGTIYQGFPQKEFRSYGSLTFSFSVR